MFDEWIWETDPTVTPIPLPELDLNLIISYALAVVNFINNHNIVGFLIIMLLAVSLIAWAYTFAVKKRPDDRLGAGLIEDVEQADPAKLSRQWEKFRRRRNVRF